MTPQLTVQDGKPSWSPVMTSAKTSLWSRVKTAPAYHVDFYPICWTHVTGVCINSFTAAILIWAGVCKEHRSYRLGPISPSAASPRPVKVPCFHWRRNNCKLLPHSSCERSPWWITRLLFPHSFTQIPPSATLVVLKRTPITFKWTGS